jgi:hypothetical protein
VAEKSSNENKPGKAGKPSRSSKAGKPKKTGKAAELPSSGSFQHDIATRMQSFFDAARLQGSSTTLRAQVGVMEVNSCAHWVSWRSAR